MVTSSSASSSPPLLKNDDIVDEVDDEKDGDGYDNDHGGGINDNYSDCDNEKDENYHGNCCKCVAISGDLSASHCTSRSSLLHLFPSNLTPR